MSYNFDQSNVFRGFAGAQMPNTRSKIILGDHLLALVNYGPKWTDKAGTIISAELEVVQSTTAQPGQKFDAAFFISKPLQKGGSLEIGKCMVFTNTLVGNRVDDGQASAEAGARLSQPTQPGRGILIRCVC